MRSDYASGTCVKIKSFHYSSFHSTKPSLHLERNPIKIVIDKIGADGTLQQQIVNQNELQRESQQIAQSKVMPASRNKNYDSLPNLRSSQSIHKVEISRSHVFNRFHYDNYQNLPPQRTSNSLHFKKPKGSNHKNIEMVFCQNKFPQFVDKTNQKIEDIFKKQQILAHEDNKKFIATHAHKEKTNTVRRPQKSTLAVCLKQFSTLEKLSIFMENDQNLREKCLRYGIERDPSRTLLLDVLNHRFSFMKQLSRRIKERIYRCLLKRDQIHPFTKINMQEYMAFYEMFVGRDAGVIETAAFIYLYLFKDNQSFAAAKSIIEQTNGPLHKQRVALDTLFAIFDDRNEELVTSIAKNQAFMKLVIDLIIEK